jgi:nicotinate-nucleotide--dimethylbenzimidazole phosphoribosyltransferase
MIPQVTWWREVGTGPTPVNPLLVLALHDDAEAVSVLAEDHAETWLDRDTATRRVADSLGVPIFVAGSGPVPDGHDLLLVGAVGRGLTTTAARLAVTRFDAEPQQVVGHGSGISDVQWMAKVADVRDRRVDNTPEPIAQLAEVLENSQVPVLLDGVTAAAAACVAQHTPPVQAPTLGEEPVQRLLLDRAEVPLWGTYGIGPGEGLGALAGLAMLRLALLATD